jgi:hypothetical protein
MDDHYYFNESSNLVTVYDSKQEQYYSLTLNDGGPTTIGDFARDRVEQQLDRFQHDFDKDLRTVFGHDVNMDKEKEQVNKVISKIQDPGLRDFELSRLPQFSERSLYDAQRGMSRYFLEGVERKNNIDRDILSHCIEDVVKLLDQYSFDLNLPKFEEIKFNRQAVSGLPYWEAKSSPRFVERAQQIYEDLKSGKLILQESLVIPGSRSQAKEPQRPSIRAIYIPDELTEVNSVAFETSLESMKSNVFNFAYHDRIREYREFNVMLRVARRKKASLISEDYSAWDTTIAYDMIVAAYKVLYDIGRKRNASKEWFRLLSNALRTMLNAKMYVKIKNKFFWFKKMLGVISGHGNTSSIGSIIHLLIVCYVNRYFKRKVYEPKYHQVIADDGRGPFSGKLSIISKMISYVFGMILRSDSHISAFTCEFKQTFYSPNFKIGIKSIVRLVNSFFRLERVMRGRPTKTDWAVRNIQLGNEAYGNPKRLWFWNFIRKRDKYIKLGIDKSSNVFNEYNPNDNTKIHLFEKWLRRFDYGRNRKVSFASDSKITSGRSNKRSRSSQEVNL